MEGSKRRPGHVLVVEDDAALRTGLERTLLRAGYDVAGAGSAAEMFALLRRRVADLVLLDLGLPDASGLDLIPELKAEADPPSIMVVTGDHSVSTVVEAMKRGADHFLAKPFEPARLGEEVERALRTHRLERRDTVERERAHPAGGQVLPEMVGSSRPVGRIRELVGKVAPTDSSVLLLGESGTGKGLIARGIHVLSPRAGGPFVEINCASIQPQLLESELFGHERGAFTGAATRKPGLMEVADGGTLFLDEIGEMEAAAQSKLLSALENRSFRRVGGVKEIGVDLRLIVATNRNLEALVKSGSFRSDLFYRLNVFQLTVPPLRERPEDISELASHFVAALNPLVGRRIETVTARTLELLTSYSWPGNVRELRNVVERAMILASGSELLPEHLPTSLRSARNTATAQLRTLTDVERDHISHVLEAVEHNVKLAAEVLGISRSTLYVKLEQYGLRPQRPVG